MLNLFTSSIGDSLAEKADEVGTSRIDYQGDAYLRTLLFQGARSAVLTAHRRNDRLSRWIVQLQARVGYSNTLVAVANMHARILWAVLARGERFDPSYAPVHNRMAGA
ncbi:hypothetical protein [Paraburkholderia caribensis]|uniref:hypothetical protein n=1 Tax=Paraburkholderia caribensis TaxID=75105 RepID=UPI00078BDF4B|nr:hypothetical protein ATN79_25690 [Paraburkholderia caribensis]